MYLYFKGVPRQEKGEKSSARIIEYLNTRWWIHEDTVSIQFYTLCTWTTTNNRTTCYLSFWVWLISLSAIISSSVHFVASVRISSIFMAESYSIVCIYHDFFIQSSVHEYVGWHCIFISHPCYCELRCINMWVQVPHMLTSFPLEILPGVG